jgi:hypothetical protein
MSCAFCLAPHLEGQLVGQDELARVELVKQQHLNALRTRTLQGLAPKGTTVEEG